MLKEGDEVELDEAIDNNGYIYEVTDKDRMGRIQMEMKVYFVDIYDHRDEKFDTFGDCESYLDEIKDEYTDIDLGLCDIESETEGEPFWVDYRNVYLSW